MCKVIVWMGLKGGLMAHLAVLDLGRRQEARHGVDWRITIVEAAWQPSKLLSQPKY